MPVSDARAESEFVTAVLGLSGLRVLDIACGYGRHARHLARKNTVIALDNNREYLHQALHGLRGPATRNLCAVSGDMRSLPFADACADAALLLFNSFGYFAAAGREPGSAASAPRQQVWKLPHVFYERQLVPEHFGKFDSAGATPAGTAAIENPTTDENLTVLREIARALKPKGQLMLELPSEKPLLRVIAKQPRRHVVTAGYEIEEQYEWDSASRVLHNRTRFRIKDRTQEGEYHLRLYTTQEIRAILRAEGFSVVHVYGGYEDVPYNKTASAVMLVHARRLSRK